MRFVYELTHERYDGEYVYVNYLGYYSTREKAEQALAQYREEPEYKAFQDGFEISEGEINRKEWTEGFFTWKK